uniref:Putative secreted protein n=1 Tax=Rhipicephalus microplus TaxID=6941 RepID=A0A6G5AGW3_RHIMP
MSLPRDRRRLAALCATLLLGMLLFRSSPPFSPRATDPPAKACLWTTTQLHRPFALTILSVLSLLCWSSSPQHEDGKLRRAIVKMKPVAGRGFWVGLMEQGACFSKAKKSDSLKFYMCTKTKLISTFTVQ